MRKFGIILLLLIVSFSLYATDKKVVSTKALPVVDGREADKAVIQPNIGSKSQSAGQVGPGTVLFPESYHEATTNSSLMREIVYHSDGTMQVAAMEQTDAGANTRSTYWSYYDGSSWALPMTRVETQRSGWGNIDTKSDGSAVITTHPTDNLGTQIAMDVFSGFGLWTFLYSGQFPDDPAADLTWPRIAVDGKDNIHFVASFFTFDPFAGLEPRVAQPYVYGRSLDGGLSWSFRYVFQAPGAEPTDPPSQDVGWLTDGDADAYAIDAWQNKVAIVGWTFNNPEGAGAYRGSDILFAESEDYGDTWTVTNITNDGLTIPPEEGEDRAGEQLTLVYDNTGEAHVVFGTFFSYPDTLEDGTIVMSQNRADALAPLYHWSPSSGLNYMLDRSGIPGALEDIRALALYGGCDIHQRGSGGGLWWPSIAVDADNNLYVTFTAPRPFDVDADTVNYPDIYATASADGGLAWGCPPVNVTDSPGTEDKQASLAKMVDDSIRFVYHSDDINGFIGGANAVQTTPASLVYLSFPAADVPTENTCETSVKTAEKNLPTGYSLEQNYPNPFNPQTEIRFSLPNNDRVSLKIYNMMGQVVDTVVDDFMQAGTHSVSWIAPADLASGVYLYYMETMNFRTHKKLILMK